MKPFLLYFRLAFGLLLLSLVMVLMGLVAGNKLPYEGDMAYISAPSGINHLYLIDVQRQFNYPIKEVFINDCCLT